MINKENKNTIDICEKCYNTFFNKSDSDSNMQERIRMSIILKIIGTLLSIMFIMGISIIIIMFAKILKEILNTKL